MDTIFSSTELFIIQKESTKKLFGRLVYTNEYSVSKMMSKQTSPPAVTRIYNTRGRHNSITKKSPKKGAASAGASSAKVLATYCPRGRARKSHWSLRRAFFGQKPRPIAITFIRAFRAGIMQVVASWRSSDDDDDRGKLGIFEVAMVLVQSYRCASRLACQRL